jgi:uncharacterized protein (TIGR00730 family)
MPRKRLAVYCGSLAPADPVYVDTARAVGKAMAARGIGVVYGGARTGLMGAVADGALEGGGEVIGVAPRRWSTSTWNHPGCTELRVVETMHERKQAFADLSDGFLTLPGGTGTMDELWEALCWAQLGLHDKPVGLLNVAGYYDGLVTFWKHMGAVGFVHRRHAPRLIVGDDVSELLDRMLRPET